GNGLKALEQLGFSHVEGMDLSPALAASYDGRSAIRVGDCRQLPFGNHSKDVVIVQGGLHHLLVLPDDSDRTLSEAKRVLKKSGRVVVVEPWQTPFLRFAHLLCESAVVRKLSNKVDALAVMTYYERETYENWLNHPEIVLSIFHKHFKSELLSIRYGKIYFTG